MSLLAKRFEDAKAGKPVRLFKSNRDGIADGEQRRDFIYVDDTVAVMLWLYEHPRVSGLFNVGTGVASSFKDMITALFSALGRAQNIEYIDMPLAIRDSYQYFTQASVDHLRQAGFSAPFTPIEAAVKTYVTRYLDRPDQYR
jgi:ADP-L-glycero-D-manno-heptose 6-epimerase